MVSLGYAENAYPAVGGVGGPNEKCALVSKTRLDRPAENLNNFLILQRSESLVSIVEI